MFNKLRPPPSGETRQMARTSAGAARRFLARRSNYRRGDRVGLPVVPILVVLTPGFCAPFEFFPALMEAVQ